MDELSGKVAVVTGGASGIGYALAERFGAEGMAVVLADVEEAQLAVAAEKLRRRGTDVLAVPTDVASLAAVEALADAAFERHGAVHVLCNNAGVAGGGLSWKVPASVWEWVLGVNLYGVVHGISAFVPRLVAQGEGHVVNTASVLGVVAAPVFGPYVASKHAVVGLSESLHHDLALMGSPVRVSVVCPSWVNTGLPDAERNWPDRLGPAPTYGRSTQAMRETLSQVVAAGLEPGDVATQVLDAVRSGRFWVFPHSELATAAVERMQAAAEGRAPAMPAALLQGPPSPA